MKQFNIEDLQIESITVTDASIENPDAILPEDDKIAKLQFSIGFVKLLSVANERILVKFNLAINCLDEKDAVLNVRGNFSTQFIFKVAHLGEYVEKADERTLLEAELAISIVNIVYTTSRGIIFTRCLGTVLGQVILPVISSLVLKEISDKSTLNLEENKPAVKKVEAKKAAPKAVSRKKAKKGVRK